MAITGLDDDCGAMPGGTSIPTRCRQATPFACARLGLAIVSGNATKYLGEVGLDVVDTDADPFDFAPAFAVVVPADLASTLAATLLDPAFLLQALPGMLRDIAEQLRGLAEGIPDAVGDPLRSAAEGLEGIADAVGEVLDLTGGDLTTIEASRPPSRTRSRPCSADFLPAEPGSGHRGQRQVRRRRRCDPVQHPSRDRRHLRAV